MFSRRRDPGLVSGLALVLGLALFGQAGAATAQFQTARYFPVVEGQSWEFLENGSVTVTKEFLTGLEDVNGVDTWVLETIGGEVGFGLEHYTNDAFGLQFHRAADGGGGGDFTPPATLLPDEFQTGDSFASSGQVVVAGGAFMFPYSSSTDVIGPAQITVPAGTFDTVVVEVALTINGSTTTDRLYLAEDVGVVRGEANIEAPGGITELVSVPEPGLPLALGVALTALCAAAPTRRGREPVRAPMG